MSAVGGLHPNTVRAALNRGGDLGKDRYRCNLAPGRFMAGNVARPVQVQSKSDDSEQRRIDRDAAIPKLTAAGWIVEEKGGILEVRPQLKATPCEAPVSP